MRKILKWSAIIVGIVAVAGLVIGFVLHEPEPKGKDTSEADVLAEKMMSSVNKVAWDTTGAVSWTFMGMNKYLWDKKRDFVRVSYGDTEVLLNTRTQDGVAYRSGTRLEGDEAKAALERAWSSFCNDSFWLNAVVKAKDPGTERSIVELEDGRVGLKVSYTSGGVTPGDSYVWLLDDDHRPTSFKMWVQIIPVGGLEVSWENWAQLSTGAWIAQNHRASKMDVSVTHLKGTADLLQMTDGKDVFAELNNMQ